MPKNLGDSMLTFEEVLSQVKRLTFAEQTKLLEALTALVRHPVEVEDDDETIPPEEIAESEAAWQDYLAGRDPGISSEDLKQKLFGNKVG
ncbi:hypothetical protein [Coleofasciculus sp. H7-2]|uniref:hypothetical protein n=1 Tax=Coleofasciculus sp. H7-2 TaxID=3351545 RepID=UPI0036716451